MTYRIVSGRKRYAAFLKLAIDHIPARVLTYPSADSYSDLRTQLAEHEENLLRKHLSLLELCEHLGKCKRAYEALYPETKHGKASNTNGKDPGTGTLPYALDAARKLGKSRATVSKLVQIYSELIESRPELLDRLQNKNHPILERVEDLSELARCGDDIPRLVDIMWRSSNTYKRTFCSLQNAKSKLEMIFEEEDREKRVAEALSRKMKDAQRRSEGPSQPDGDQGIPEDPSDKKPEQAISTCEYQSKGIFGAGLPESNIIRQSSPYSFLMLLAK